MDPIKGLPVKDVEYCKMCGHQIHEGGCPQCASAETKGKMAESEKEDDAEETETETEDANESEDDDDEEPSVKGIKQNGQGVTGSY